VAKSGYVWDGSSWIPFTAPVGAVPNAVSNYASVAPVGPQIGQMWFDASTGILKVYTGSVWQTIGVPYSPSAPASPSVGMLWVDSTGPSLKVYDGVSWVSAGGSATDSDQNIIANQVFR
jgi:hypothetical protein